MFCLFVGEKRGEDMTNKQKLMFGSLVGIVALLGIILLLFIRQSQGQPHTSRHHKSTQIKWLSGLMVSCLPMRALARIWQILTITQVVRIC